MKIKFLIYSCLNIICLASMTIVQAETVTVAVASNFSTTMKAIVHEFEKDTGHKARLAFSSSGKLFAQIKHGAPFQIFLSADVKQPKKLENDGLTVVGSRFVYAIGTLVLWSASPQYINNSADVLKKGTFKYLALANPKLAPYGVAARQSIEKLHLLPELQHKFVQGENIAQTYQFVASANAKLGFVALSQVMKDGKVTYGSAWTVPSDLYDPIYQEAVLLISGKKNSAAVSLMRYLQSAKSKAIIKSYGYRL